MEDFKQSLFASIKSIKNSIGDNNEHLKYTKLKIKFNPFPAAAIAQNTHFDPVDEEIKDRIKYFIEVTYTKGENEQIGDYAGLTIVGEYGYGKTHLMKYIESLINGLSNREDIDFKAITSFIDKPDDEPKNIIHKIVEDLEPDNLRRLIWAMVYPRLIPNYDLENFKQTYFKHLYADGFDIDELLDIPKLTNPLIFYDLFKRKGGSVKLLQEQTREIIKTVIVDDGLIADRFMTLIFPEKKADANWDVLTGYTNSKDIQKKEINFLNSIIKILRHSEFNMLYVFIDEFEDLSKLKGAKLTNYINTLNTMINRQRKWAVIVSLTQDALDTIKKESPPLYDRINTVEVRLKPLSLATARRLTDNYLNHAKAEETLPLIFSNELLEEMLNRTEGNYRSFIRLANMIIEEASKMNHNLPLEQDILNRTLLF